MSDAGSTHGRHHVACAHDGPARRTRRGGQVAERLDDLGPGSAAASAPRETADSGDGARGVDACPRWSGPRPQELTPGSRLRCPGSGGCTSREERPVWFARVVLSPEVAAGFTWNRSGSPGDFHKKDRLRRVSSLRGSSEESGDRLSEVGDTTPAAVATGGRALGRLRRWPRTGPRVVARRRSSCHRLSPDGPPATLALHVKLTASCCA